MMQFLTKSMVVIALSLSSFMLQAQTLEGQTFQDQFEQPLVYGAQTKWVLLSSEKAGGKLVKESLEALELTDLAAKNGLYIADVSAMPGLITKMFALPKMRDYAFKIAVVNDAQALAGWPKQADKVSAIELDGFAVTSVEYFDSAQALQAWIKARM